MSNGIKGSAKIEGVARVPGAGGSMTTTANPSTKRAMIFWAAAFSLLFIFHIGGSNVGARG